MPPLIRSILRAFDRRIHPDDAAGARHASWEIDVSMPSWRGMGSSLPPADPRDPSSRGLVTIVFTPEMRHGDDLEEVDRSLIAWVIDNEEDLANAVLDAILRSGSNADGVTPMIAGSRHATGTRSDLRSLIRPISINVHPLHESGLAYLGFEFECTWDPDGGLGVMMHGVRAVAIGTGGVATSTGIAVQDADRLQDRDPRS